MKCPKCGNNGIVARISGKCALNEDGSLGTEPGDVSVENVDWFECACCGECYTLDVLKLDSIGRAASLTITKKDFAEGLHMGEMKDEEFTELAMRLKPVLAGKVDGYVPEFRDCRKMEALLKCILYRIRGDRREELIHSYFTVFLGEDILAVAEDRELGELTLDEFEYAMKKAGDALCDASGWHDIIEDLITDYRHNKEREKKERCVECGDSVQAGSGKYVNRIPVVDASGEDGRPYPDAEYMCHECDSKIKEDA